MIFVYHTLKWKEKKKGGELKILRSRFTPSGVVVVPSLQDISAAPLFPATDCAGKIGPHFAFLFHLSAAFDVAHNSLLMTLTSSLAVPLSLSH